MADDEKFEVLSTEPLVFDRPRRTLRRLRVALIAFGVAILVATAVGSYVGYAIGAHRTNVQLAALNADRTTNRAKIMAQQRAANRLIEQNREAVCVLVEREPPDPAVDAIRIRFHCGPYLPPGAPGRQKVPAPPATAAPSGPASQPRPTPTPQPTRTAPARPTPTPAPTPTPPRPTPSPTSPGRSPTPSPGPTHVICVLGICLL